MTTTETTHQDGADLIAAERQRQIGAEGWAPEHDDEHSQAELARAAVRYTLKAVDQVGWNTAGFGIAWPWYPEWWKPSDDPVRNLVKAGALIAAEIDRLERVRGVSS